jgi:hypothetical protein
MSKIGKWFKSIINWFKNLFKKKEKPSTNPSTPSNPSTPTGPTQPNGYGYIQTLVVDKLTSWEDTKLFREYVNENDITPNGEVVDNGDAEDVDTILKKIASELLFELEKSEERYHNLRIRKIEEWKIR